MKLSRLVSALLLLIAVFCIASYGLSVPELAAQESGTISIIIGGTGASTSAGSSSYTRSGGGGGYISCTIISPGAFSCATSSTSGGGDEGTSTTISATQTSSLPTNTMVGNTTETSTTTNIPEFRSEYVLLVFAIGSTLVLCRSQQFFRRKKD